MPTVETGKSEELGRIPLPGNDVSGPVCRVHVASLLPADSPRLDGENLEHARLLAETEGALPPILVHRPTMRVIDGMHRLRAAVLRGDDHIDARFFQGGEDAAFVLAVQANIAHGLPLSLADRESAAQRVIRSHAHWSDRVIAGATGLAAKTIAAIRRRMEDELPQPEARMGRDGRLRPLNSAEGRRIASQIIAAQPEASLREIAKSAGISPATARDVRERMRRGDDPLPPRQRGAEAGEQPRAVPPAQRGRRAPVAPDRTTIMLRLRRDPALRFCQSGRMLLRWLDARTTGPDGWEEFVDDIPTHCMYVVADIARGMAEDWMRFAQQLKERSAATADASVPGPRPIPHQLTATPHVDPRSQDVPQPPRAAGGLA